MSTELLLIIGILILIICLLVTVFVLVYYSGLFYPIEVGAGSPPIGQVTVAYKFVRGPYKECGALFTEVSCLAPKNRCVGIYYDDPKTVPKDRTRYIIGCILSENNIEAEPSLKETFETNGYSFIQLPAVANVVKTSFPFKTELSVMIAVARVYPRLSAYIAENKLCAYPFLEIYDGKTIEYMAPLSQQEEFFVAEYHKPADSMDVSTASLDPSQSITDTSSIPDDNASSAGSSPIISEGFAPSLSELSPAGSDASDTTSGFAGGIPTIKLPTVTFAEPEVRSEITEQQNGQKTPVSENGSDASSGTESFEEIGIEEQDEIKE